MNRSIKKFAKSNGLNIQHKTASGNLLGHVVTLSEGKEIVKIQMTTHFEDINKQQDFEEALNRKLLSRDLRVLELKFLPSGISSTLSYRYPTDIANVEAFVNYFFPLLNQYDAVHTADTQEVLQQGDTVSKKRFAFF
ncbi:MAG: hypothetical protein IJ427_12325 [Lachnospiraceae bacterium]|nr:hypothetical protein [Lachnospiraceae bacterium]